MLLVEKISLKGMNRSPLGSVEVLSCGVTFVFEVEEGALLPVTR